MYKLFHHSLFFFILFIWYTAVNQNALVFAASCTPKHYTECEMGNPTACLGTGTGKTHNVPKGDRADVSLDSSCNYTCVDLGLCNQPTQQSTNATNTPATATNTPVPQGSLQTTADVTFHVEGIDSNNIPNVVPPSGRHGTSGWPFTIYVYQGTTLVKTFADSAIELTTDPTSPLYGTFHNPTFKMTDLPSGSYTFYVRTPMGSLRTQIGTAPIAIIGGQNNVLVTINPNNPTLTGIPLLVMGDINGDNQITLQDYSILSDCYGTKATSTACITDKNQLIAQFPTLPNDFLPGDLNDNGNIDGIDYNTLLRGPLGQIGAGGGTTPAPTFPVSPTPRPTTAATSTPGVSGAPSGTKQTITAYGFGGRAAYQPVGSPWWALNNAWGGPPPNTQAIDYYPNNFPNYSTIRWTYGGSGGNVLGYPEIIIGDQNGQSVKSPNGVEPAWYGKTLGSLSHLILSWDITINNQNGNNWDILFENHMNGHETGIILKDPGWWARGTHFNNLGGISGYGIPSAWASGSFAIIPDSVVAGTPMLKGSVDLLPIFKWAFSNGWMSSNERIYGMEFGVEPTNGSGNVTFNSISVDIQ